MRDSVYVVAVKKKLKGPLLLLFFFSSNTRVQVLVIEIHTTLIRKLSDGVICCIVKSG